MKVVGHAVHALGKRLLIVRCDPAQLPRLYADVIDRKLKPLGKVVDVFGSVSAPYAAILCRSGFAVAAGEKVFIP